MPRLSVLLYKSTLYRYMYDLVMIAVYKCKYLSRIKCKKTAMMAINSKQDIVSK